MAVSAKDKIAALEYFILRLAEWNMESNQWESIHFFESYNNFSVTKVLLMPFYMSTANGKDTRNVMFSFYDKFYAREFGYSEGDVESNLLGNLKYIQFTEDRKKIKLNAQSSELFIGAKFNNQKFENENPIKFDFEKLTDKPDLESIYDVIDHSIDVYRQNDWSIGDYEEKALIRLCRMHSGWQVYRMLHKLRDHQVQKEILIEEKSVYAKEVENRLLV